MILVRCPGCGWSKQSRTGIGLLHELNTHLRFCADYGAFFIPKNKEKTREQG